MVAAPGCLYIVCVCVSVCVCSFVNSVGRKGAVMGEGMNSYKTPLKYVLQNFKGRTVVVQLYNPSTPKAGAGGSP